MTQKISVWRICKNLNQLKDNNFKLHFRATSICFFLNKKNPLNQKPISSARFEASSKRGGAKRREGGYTDWPFANFLTAVKMVDLVDDVSYASHGHKENHPPPPPPPAPLVGVLLLLLHRPPGRPAPLVGVQLVTWSNLGEVPPPPCWSDGGLFRGGRWKYPPMNLPQQSTTFYEWIFIIQSHDHIVTSHFSQQLVWVEWINRSNHQLLNCW